MRRAIGELRGLIGVVGSGEARNPRKRSSEEKNERKIRREKNERTFDPVKSRILAAQGRNPK